MTILFHIACPTCRVRLQVRSAAAIGQILTCPKCQAMVKVEPPPDWEDPEAAQETVDEIPVPRQSDEAAAAREDEAASADAPVLPGSDWVSPETQRLRRRLLLGIVAVVGLALVAVLGAWWWSRPADSDAPRVEQSQPQDSGRLEKGVADPGPPEDAEQPAVTGDEGAKKAGEEPPVDSGSDAKKKEKAGDDGGTEAEPEHQPMPTERPTDESDSGADASDNDAEEAPPGLMPAQRRAKAEEEAGTALAQLEAMIHPPDSEVEEQAGDQPAPVAALVERRRQRDVSALLKWKIPRLSLVDVPLDRLADIVWQVSGVPVTLDLDHLAAADVDWHKKVSGTWEDAPLQDILDSVAEQAGVTFRTTDGGLRLTADAPERFEVAYDLRQLPGGESDAGRLTELLPRWLKGAGWQTEGLVNLRDGHLAVNQPGAVHRAMRIMQARYLWHRWQRLTDEDKLWEPLDRKWTLLVVRPTPMADVLRELAELSGVEILVDWESAAAVGFEPDAEVTASAFQQPLGVILRDLLGESELTFRWVNPRTIVIVGAAPAVNGLGFHSIPAWWGDGEALDQRVAKLLEAIDPQGRRAAYFDVRGRCLLLLGTPREHAVLERALRTPPQARPEPKPEGS